MDEHTGDQWETNGNSSIILARRADGDVTLFLTYPKHLFYSKPGGGVEQRPTARVGLRERRANTELMAKAPRLLRMLRLTWDFIENVPEDDPDRAGKCFALREQVREVLP